MAETATPLAIMVVVSDGSGIAPLPLAYFSESRARAITHIVQEHIRESVGVAPAPASVAAPAPRSGFERTGTALQPDTSRSTARASGYTGDICPQCGSDKMKRTGHCVTCENCGNNDGCS